MKVLISAYACDPSGGSEPGAGWNWSLAASASHDVWVITRSNNRDAIESALAVRPCERLHFTYVDLPRWARWWKRGQRGVRLYYTLWQFALLRAARRLHRQESFDVVHHLTFASIWLPALVSLVDAPFVFGPVGGGPAVPIRLYPEVGLGGVVSDLALRLFRRLSRLNPLVRIAWARARLTIVQNAETRRVFRSRGLVVVHPNASVPFDVAGRECPHSHTAIFAGRLVPWKGASLAVRALAHLPGWRLVIVGTGPDEKRLRRIARRLSVSERVLFAGWAPQRDLWTRLCAADLLLHPSMKDDSPFVVAEAVALGVPVVALQTGGPVAIAELAPGAINLVPIDGGAERIAGRLAVEAVHAASTLRLGNPPPPLTIADLQMRVDSFYETAVETPRAGKRIFGREINHV